MRDIEASDLAALIAEQLRETGAKVGTSGAAGPSRFDFLAVKLPNGQTFKITIEEN